MTFGKIAGFVHGIRAAHRTAHEIERLNRMNGADLAGLGLKRSEITTHAFRKYFRQV